jgi:hypothetical protein
MSPGVTSAPRTSLTAQDFGSVAGMFFLLPIQAMRLPAIATAPFGMRP